MTGTVRLSDIYSELKDSVEFVNIYIREAHPVDGWWFGASPLMAWMTKRYSPRASLDLYEPKTLAERRAAAKDMIAATDYPIPLIVDDIDNAVNDAYAAWPTRLYLIDTSGRVAYAAGLGPYDFHPEKLRDAIVALLGANAQDGAGI